MPTIHFCCSITIREDLDTFRSRLLPNAEFILIHTLVRLPKTLNCFRLSVLGYMEISSIWACKKRRSIYWEGENILRDPYEVLEINKGAGKEEIQKAYRRLVKKYHPDQYRNHPLEKLAEEKMAEINAAYDYLMKNGAGDYYKGSGQSREAAENTRFFFHGSEC